MELCAHELELVVKIWPSWCWKTLFGREKCSVAGRICHRKHSGFGSCRRGLWFMWPGSRKTVLLATNINCTPWLSSSLTKAAGGYSKISCGSIAKWLLGLLRSRQLNTFDGFSMLF